MKTRKMMLLAVLLVCLNGFSQRQVAKKVNELIQQNVTFRHYAVLDATNATLNTQMQQAVSKATLATLKTQELAALVANKNEYIELEVPYQGNNISVQLYKVDIFAEGFHTDTDQANSIAYEPGIYYRGIVKNDPTSVAAFSFFNGEFIGMVSSPSLRNLVVGKVNTPNNTSDYIIYSDADLKVKSGFVCHSKDQVSESTSNKNQNPATPESTRCVTVYLEIDTDIYQENGSNITATNNWVTAVFNNVKTLYANDGITISLKSTFVWTTQDPYNGDNSSAYLDQFHNLRPVFDGDVGQLLGRDSNLGGVAVVIDGLCSENNYSYSDVYLNYETVPVYSWTINVVTHEFGHLFGSPHTHACVWNGNNTPIDNCAPYALGENWEGGECMSNPPLIPNEGTIMSYCHLTDSGVNLALGFGPQPAARILSTVNSATCLSTDCINTCFNKIVNPVVTNVTNTGATIGWTDLAAATSWQVSVSTFSGTPVFTAVSTNPYTVSGLMPNTFYRFQVRPICGAGLLGADKQAIFVTGTTWCSGVQITDTGGALNDYTDSETYVRTIIPNLPNKKIVLTFTTFDLELDYDYLYVYDGNSTSAPSFDPQGFTGDNIPGPFTSTAVDGSLTVKFYSDGGVIAPGYVANVACENHLGTTAFEPNIDFTYFPNPTNGMVTIVSKTQISEVSVYNVEGRLLYKKIVNGVDAKIDMTSFAVGTYFFKLKFNDKEANFKIMKSN